MWASADYYNGYDGQRLQSAITKGFATLTSGLISDFAFCALDDSTGNPKAVDWANAGNRRRQELRHVAGPFREWLRLKLVNAPRPLLFDPAWRSLIQREHYGFESPDSSQAFAVNLFAPVAHNSDLARELVNRLLPGTMSDQDEVTVLFEQSFKDPAKQLNEQGIATQVDVVFNINGTGLDRRLLVEVKLAEEDFGSCKGWLDPKYPPTRNPNRSGCCSVLEHPEMRCYMATQFGRTYWTHLKPLLAAMPGEPCPFRGSLYQLMRNYLSARLLGTAQFIICLHPENSELRILHLPVCGHHDAVSAFRAILGKDSVIVWNARDVIEHIVTLEPALHPWRNWMLGQYFDT